MGLFATAAGTLVANIYYAQPLLADIARGFGRRPEQAGLLVTLAQLGYALGVLFIVPLGDGVDRRRLVSIMLTVCAGSLVAASLSVGFAMLALASLVVGVASSATMVLVPYVASHAADAERGRRTGQVMTGLLLGILLARTVSGFVAEWTSWRVIYALAAVAVSILAIALRRAYGHRSAAPAHRPTVACSAPWPRWCAPSPSCGVAPSTPFSLWAASASCGRG
jgi:predicted MFS family arabinose efflux permease